jgi:hypothetical protein
MNIKEDAVIGGVPLRITLGPLTKDGCEGSFTARGDAATKLIGMLKTNRELDYESSTDDGQVRTGRVRVGRKIVDEISQRIDADFTFIDGPKLKPR